MRTKEEYLHFSANVTDDLCDCGEIELERNCYAGRDIDVQGVAEDSSLDMFDQYSDFLLIQ